MNMGGYSETRKGFHKKSRFIACSSGRRGLGCKFIQWEYNNFEQLVLRFCKAVDFSQVLGINTQAETDINNAMGRLESIKQDILDLMQRNDALLDALEKAGQGEPPQLLLNRLKANEAKLVALNDDKRQAEDDVVRKTNSRVDVAVQQDLIRELLQRLETLEGSELHLLRVRLSEAVKRVITKIVTFPGGRWYSDEEVENYRRDLIASDEFDEDSIDRLCEALDTQPNKQNRLLMLVFANGEHRTVLSSGKVLDRKTPPPSDWDVRTLFVNLDFQVFKRVDA
jgi:hypothetical protein